MDIIDERLCILSSLKNHIEAAPTKRSAQRIGGPESWRAGYKRGTLHVAPVALSSQHALQDCESNYFFFFGKFKTFLRFSLLGKMWPVRKINSELIILFQASLSLVALCAGQVQSTKKLKRLNSRIFVYKLPSTPSSLYILKYPTSQAAVPVTPGNIPGLVPGSAAAAQW